MVISNNTMVISFSLLFFFITCINGSTRLFHANRLLQAKGCTDDVGICPDGTYVSRDDNNNCEFYPCPDGTCITKDKCVNPDTNQCESEAQCLIAYPCAVNYCILPEVCVANYCGGCHAICKVPTCSNSNPCPKDTFCDDTPSGPVCLNIGDTCGSPPYDCPALRCPCGLCPNIKTQFGCCSTCVVEDFGNGPTCSGVINQERVCKNSDNCKKKCNEECNGTNPNCPDFRCNYVPNCDCISILDDKEVPHVPCDANPIPPGSEGWGPCEYDNDCNGDLCCGEYSRKCDNIQFQPPNHISCP